MVRINRAVLLCVKAFRLLVLRGPRACVERFRAIQFERVRRMVFAPTLTLAVKDEDALALDWTHPPSPEPLLLVREEPTHIAWIMSPPSATSGGHQNLFRFIDFAERAGHRCSIYFYTSADVRVNVADLSRTLRETPSYPNVHASFENYDPSVGVSQQAQAIFATSWETAYPAFLDRSAARRFYFVQDYEPSFYAAGAEAQLAENTYRFNFHGITAGKWLATKLRDEFGMRTDHFDFSADPNLYHLTHRSRRNQIFFYARPSTPRRGFELGVLALTEFAKKHPEVTINLAGERLDGYELPFAGVDHQGLNVTQLNEVYNRCAAALVLSFSNMSLLPLELMASGVVPVVNDAPNTRLVVDSPHICYVPAAPRPLARALSEALLREDQVEHAVAISQSFSGSGWADSGRQFVEAYERAMRG